MPLISLRNIQLGFGGPLLLDHLDLTLEPGDRACLLGRNGAGKSTLMKVISGEIQPEDGARVVGQGVRIARLVQEVPERMEGRVFELVADGLGAVGELAKQYHRLSVQLQDGGDDELLTRLARVQHALEAADGWSTEQRVETLISRLSLPGDAEFSQLSGGLKRRVLLARALVIEPDLLLLDEPTNHLDIDAIAWLEEFLLGYAGALLFVSHDRMFLQRLATRILELDRGRLSDWPGDYQNYLRRREEMLNAEAKELARFDKRLAQEETWIRQGIKARRTRNEGRVRALKSMRDERRRRREQLGKVKLQLQTGELSGKLVARAEDIGYSWDGKPIVQGFSTTIVRGDRIGVIGPNGVGKTTLLNLLLGTLRPEQGRVKLGTRLEIAYFDQMRSQLDEEKSVQDNVGEGSDQVEINGREKHIIGYLQDFLFSPERARTPVKALSGGERNRLLLARLFTRPANVLVLDEPTNDLDVETLELLEELLLDYSGTLLLVSHDRAFLNNVVTSCLVFEGEGRVVEYVGGYDDWLRQRAPESAASAPAPKPAKPSRPKPPARKPKPTKLSYKEQRELEALPAQIEILEQEQAGLHTAMADPAFYRRDKADIAAAKQRMEALELELSEAYRRWESLEGMQG
jgi:ATP-binding cassette subfamily F protein uup